MNCSEINYVKVRLSYKVFSEFFKFPGQSISDQLKARFSAWMADDEYKREREIAMILFFFNCLGEKVDLSEEGINKAAEEIDVCDFGKISIDKYL